MHTRPAAVNHFSDINTWWRGQGTCINGSWKKFQKAVNKQQAKKEKEEEEERRKEEQEQEEEEEEVKLP